MYFDIFSTEEEVKKRFRILSKLFHPDHGGPLNLMQELNFYYEKKLNEIDAAKEELFEKVRGSYAEMTENDDDECLEKIQKILKFAEINKRFDPAFVENVFESYEERGFFTDSQKKSIDKIYKNFRVEERLKT